ncbi:hypothetical protein JB92DRAFT_1930034 [Gautieria morchelliformis]|nr:hypothetical protein JB92DRAFT_1930034 [Gautieria morchelliformis]
MSYMDRYTPCTSRLTEAYYKQRKHAECRGANCHEVILQHFSSFLSRQESRLSRLMRNFDVDFYDDDSNCNWLGIMDSVTSSLSNPFGNMTPPSSALMSPVPQSQSNKTRPNHFSAPSARPGRLSPATMQMVLSSSTSTVSGISSASDTSYDSGLYQWLGLRMDSCGPKSSSENEIPFNEPIEVDSSNMDISVTSSHNAYSRPSPKSHIALPLSPPATACLPFSNNLSEIQPSVKPTHIPDPSSPSQHLTSIESNQGYDLGDLIAPILSNNLSLKQCMPSAAVLRHFQQVIDELRRLYAPNDMANNTPNTTRARRIISIRRSQPGSYTPCRVSRRLSSRNPVGSVTQIPSADPPMDNHMSSRDSRTTRELYTEMAVMLFTEVANEEAQITNLRNLVNRLEVSASRKRKVALVIGAWGRESY